MLREEWENDISYAEQAGISIDLVKEYKQAKTNLLGNMSQTAASRHVVHAESLTRDLAAQEGMERRILYLQGVMNSTNKQSHNELKTANKYGYQDDRKSS